MWSSLVTVPLYGAAVVMATFTFLVLAMLVVAAVVGRGRMPSQVAFPTGPFLHAAMKRLEWLERSETEKASCPGVLWVAAVLASGVMDMVARRRKARALGAAAAKAKAEAAQ
jgi:hypothetical protein